VAARIGTEPQPETSRYDGARSGYPACVIERVDAYQQRHRWLGLPIAVVYKFLDDSGTYLAALITYYSFVSIFPLLLLLVTMLGYVLHGNDQLQQAILHSALREFPIIGDQIGQNVRSLHGSVAGVIVGALGGLYGGLGVANAGQYASNTIWAVPHTRRPNVFAQYGRSLALLLIVGIGLIATTGLAGLTTAQRPLPGLIGSGMDLLIRVGATAVAAAINTGLFLLAFRALVARHVTVRQLLAGAVAAGVLWQALQELGTFYVEHELRGVSATYGLFGIVLGLLAWIYLGALLFLLCSEINVVRVQRLWPRSLPTLFTDNVRLTGGDRRAYRGYATAEQRKGFETINVEFDEPDPSRDRSQ